MNTDDAPREEADFDIRCSHCNGQNEENLEYCPCPQMHVVTYGGDILDIEIVDPITPWKNNFHTLIRMNYEQAKWLQWQIERWSRGYVNKIEENCK